jgi:hypothetical protein
MVMAGWRGSRWKAEDRPGPDAIGEMPRTEVDEAPTERLLQRGDHAVHGVSSLGDLRPKLPFDQPVQRAQHGAKLRGQVQRGGSVIHHGPGGAGCSRWSITLNADLRNMYAQLG